MQLRTVNSKLTLGSAYKMFVWGWILGWATFMVPALVAVVIVVLASGQTSELVPVLLAFPIVIVLQAFIFGGLLTFGL